MKRITCTLAATILLLTLVGTAVAKDICVTDNQPSPISWRFFKVKALMNRPEFPEPDYPP